METEIFTAEVSHIILVDVVHMQIDRVEQIPQIQDITLQEEAIQVQL